jgi:hypothetical protein
MPHLRCALAAFLLSATASWADPPREIASVIHAQTPYGKGTYTALIITAYDAELWADTPQWNMKAPFALTLRYHLGFSTDDFVSRAKSEMKHVDPSLTDADLQRFGDAMAPVFPPVKDGDEITALYQPGKPVQVYKNGTATGAVKAKGFATPFFGIWLSPHTSSPSLRAALLHQK